MASGFGDAIGDVDVGAAGFGIAAGVVVNQDQRCRPDVEGLADDLARVDRRLIDRTFAGEVIEHEAVLRIEEQHPHPLVAEMRHIER